MKKFSVLIKIRRKTCPWFIHLAEGTDDIAAGEYQRLKKLGCVGENTVLVHVVGMTQDDIDDASSIIRGIVWCPSTNHYLLGKSIQMSAYSHRGWPKDECHIALGSDSRLTADGDLLMKLGKFHFNLTREHHVMV